MIFVFKAAENFSIQRLLTNTESDCRSLWPWSRLSCEWWRASAEHHLSFQRNLSFINAESECCLFEHHRGQFLQGGNFGCFASFFLKLSLCVTKPVNLASIFQLILANCIRGTPKTLWFDLGSQFLVPCNTLLLVLFCNFWGQNKALGSRRATEVFQKRKIIQIWCPRWWAHHFKSSWLLRCSHTGAFFWPQKLQKWAKSGLLKGTKNWLPSVFGVPRIQLARISWKIEAILSCLVTQRLYFKKKMTRNSQYSRPAETDQYIHMGQFLQGGNFGCFASFFSLKSGALI